jgi:hypothetical protein
MRTRTDGKPTHCYCDRELIDTIVQCSADDCDCRFTILTCQSCERGWGFDHHSQSWVELEEEAG